MRSERNISLKIPLTPPGIDPGTVRLVAKRLNHYTTPGPGLKDLVKGISKLLEVMHGKRLNLNVVTLTTVSIHKSVVFSSTTFNYTSKYL
jgi:hypothetical protein